MLEPSGFEVDSSDMGWQTGELRWDEGSDAVNSGDAPTTSEHHGDNYGRSGHPPDTTHPELIVDFVTTGNAGSAVHHIAPTDPPAGSWRHTSAEAEGVPMNRHIRGLNGDGDEL